MSQSPNTAPALPFQIPSSRWSDSEAAGKSPAEQLLYRSNLLGADLTVTNYGGGNTSAKMQERDPLTGETTPVLWVKGSGGDIGSMKLDGFATLYIASCCRWKSSIAGSNTKMRWWTCFPTAPST